MQSKKQIIKPYQLWNLLLSVSLDGDKEERLVYVLGLNSDDTLSVINLEPNHPKFGMISVCNILLNVDTRIV